MSFSRFATLFLFVTHFACAVIDVEYTMSAITLTTFPNNVAGIVQDNFDFASCNQSTFDIKTYVPANPPTTGSSTEK